MEQKIIALVDCDCFFVSCERVDNPRLIGKSVCVTTGATSKGIVVSRSNEAKALGIKMGQPMFQLEGRFPGTIYLPGRLTRYSEISKQVMKILRDFTPDVEEVSIDEAYLDLTGMSKMYNLSYKDLIIKIRQTVLEKVKVPVSIGLSTSKTLAKLASDKAKKTGGIFIIHPSQIRDILKDVELDEVCGIGKQSLKHYYQKGIVSINDLLDKEVSWVRQAFGINGEKLRYELAGISVSSVNPIEEAPQSIQDTRAFEDFTNNLEFLIHSLPEHIHRASQKMRKWDGYCKVLSVMLRTKDFIVYEQETKLKIPTNSESTLLKEAQKLLRSIYRPHILYRSTGITLKDLVFGKEKQASLFGEVGREDDKISHLIDDLEKKYGKQVIKLGG